MINLTITDWFEATRMELSNIMRYKKLCDVRENIVDLLNSDRKMFVNMFSDRGMKVKAASIYTSCLIRECSKFELPSSTVIIRLHHGNLMIREEFIAYEEDCGETVEEYKIDEIVIPITSFGFGNQ